jgi:hypothetical protein
MRKFSTRKQVSYIVGPDGSPLTMADLPDPNTKRWVARKKAVVVAAVRGGLLSLDDARTRYALTVEEYCAWERAIENFGLPGLQATRTKEFRPTGPSVTGDWSGEAKYDKRPVKWTPSVGPLVPVC